MRIVSLVKPQNENYCFGHYTSLTYLNPEDVFIDHEFGLLSVTLRPVGQLVAQELPVERVPGRRLPHDAQARAGARRLVTEEGRGPART